MKAKIVIASTLKPVIDPRAYEKIGKSLANTGNYDVHIIGSTPTTEEKVPNITLYPLLSNIKESFFRLFIPWKILSKIQIIKPDILIIGTHELLIIGLIYKLRNHSKLVYDVRENYFNNLIYQHNYPWLIKYLLALYVRSKELISALFIDHFLLAEKCYMDELNFLHNRYTVIENKFKKRDISVIKTSHSIPQFLLSGTISEPYGVFDAITFFKGLPANNFKLVIIGHCPNKKTLLRLQADVEGIDNIDLEVSSQPISQYKIDEKISDKTIGLLPYKENKSTRNKMPTKLYEYIGRGIPILISPNHAWSKIIDKYNAGQSIDFAHAPKLIILEVINSLIDSTQQSDLKDIMWINEQISLLATIDELFLAK